MFSATRIRDRIRLLELLFICRAAFLKRVPFLRWLHRNVTADLTLLEPRDAVAVAFIVDFRSPYFHLPVPVEKAQIGEVNPEQGFQPTSFRFFDWQTWAHIDGILEWRGERRGQVNGKEVNFITGFSYRITKLPPVAGNLGLRLAEGVEGTVRISCGARVTRVQFNPVFWLLEASGSGFRPVQIQSNELMGLIVSLFAIGSGDSRLFDSAVDHLQQWAELNLDARKPFQSLPLFLRYIRDWGPLKLEPMYPGIVLVLQRLRVEDPERHLFDFFADNWGVRSNRNGRLLAVRLLEVLANERAQGALQAILDLVKNRNMDPSELDLIRSAAQTVEAKGVGVLPSRERAGD